MAKNQSDNLSDKTVLVYEYGLAVSTAIRLSREFGRVLYFKPWKKSSPTIHERVVGDGYDEIERVRDFWKVVNDVDLFIFTDIHDGDLQLHLESLGKRVWGSRTADKYEYNRLLFKKALKQVDLPIVPFKVCNGMSELRKYLSESEDKWIKISCCRGDQETWHHINYALSQPKLDALDYYYGPVKEEIQFVVDDAIETTVEVGYDGFLVTDPDGKAQFPKLAFQGYEHKNLAHILASCPYDELSPLITEVNDKFAPLLAKENFRSQVGTEVKCVGDEPYFIDLTARQPCPPGEIHLEIIKNLGEIMWHGSVGELVEPECDYAFGSEVMLYSSWGETNHQPVIVPEAVRQYVKLFNCYRKDGVDWVVPSLPVTEPQGGGRHQIGAVVGLGDTIEEANNAAKEVCEQIQGFETEPQIEALSECLRRIQKGEKEGVEFAEEVPDPATVMEGDDD